MPFLRSSTRPQAVDCFFCLSPSLLPPSVPDRKGKGRLAEVGSKWNWRCERCGCWNIKDERGEMVSDVPAMHNSSLNKASFSLRATPSSSRLPSLSSSSSSPFCHSCLANQTLIMNMLANYLPDDDDPSFPSLYASLPAYLANLHLRYPPVCSSCQPAVDAALRKSDQRAQGEALGSALRRGAARHSDGISIGQPGMVAVVVWRIRGILFCIGTGLAAGAGLLAWMAPQNLSSIPRLSMGRLPLHHLLLLFHSLSVLWIFWDPYWLRRVRSRDRAKVKGREVWIRNMLVVLAVRILGSSLLYMGPNMDPSSPLVTRTLQASFGLDLVLLLHALISLRISQPVSIQLVRPKSSYSSLTSPSSPAHPTPYSHDTPSAAGLSALSLDNNPVHHTNPIFGQPSLQNTPHKASTSPDRPEPMDWEPSPAAALSNGGWTTRPPDWNPDDEDNGEIGPNKSDWDGFGIGRQRIFPQPSGADETGLETLLAGWGIGASQPANPQHLSHGRTVVLPASSSNNGGLVISEGFLRQLMLILVSMRSIGALSALVISCLSHIRLTFLARVIDLAIADRADQVVSAAEAGVILLNIMVISTGGARSTPSQTARWVVLVMSLTLQYLKFLNLVPAAISIVHYENYWISQILTWTGWATLDLACWYIG